MLRICQNCGITFEGKPTALKCPKCTAAVRQSSLGQRICRGCGQSFQGGPHAWYCPDCREEREKKKKAECNARQKAGTTRKIGSTDFCTICGKEYTVTSGNQRYCPSCAPDAIREIDREQSRNWAKENNPPEKRRTANQAAAAPLTCVICGKTFAQNPKRRGAITCSRECSQKLIKRDQQRYEASHREIRNAQQRMRKKKKKELLEKENIND